MVRKGRLAAVLLVISVVAVACGGDGTQTATTGTVTTRGSDGPAAPTSAEIAGLEAKVAGGGSSFVDAFAQAVNTDFNKLAGSERVTYAKSGSSDGRKQLATKTLDFAGSDSVAKPEETFQGGTILYFPSVAAPIAVGYNLAGVEKLRLRPETVAGIFSAQITRWDDPAVRADNPEAKLPASPIVVVHRSDGSGTTNNFTKFLKVAAPSVWTLGSGDTVNWPAGTQGAEKNSGVAAVVAQTAGSVGYVDLADAVKAGLAVASVRNSDGRFVAPTAKGTSAALDNAKVNADLTYDPINAPGSASYPITSPTYFLTYATQPDAAKASTLKTWLRYMLTTGQAQALKLGYVGLPSSLQRKAYDQVDRITG